MKIIPIECTRGTDVTSTVAYEKEVLQVISEELIKFSNVTLVGTHEWITTTASNVSYIRYIYDVGLDDIYVTMECCGYNNSISNYSHGQFMCIIPKEGALEDETISTSTLAYVYMNMQTIYSQLTSGANYMNVIHDENNNLLALGIPYCTAKPSKFFTIAKSKNGKKYGMFHTNTATENIGYCLYEGTNKYYISHLPSMQCNSDNEVYIEDISIVLSTQTGIIKDILEYPKILRNTNINNGTCTLIKVDDKYYRELSVYLWIEDLIEE